MESQSCQLLIVQCGVLLRFVNAESNDRMEEHAPMNNEEMPTLGFREGSSCWDVCLQVKGLELACICSSDQAQHHHNVLQEDSCIASCLIQHCACCM
jgi:hypothetical protein